MTTPKRIQRLRYTRIDRLRIHAADMLTKFAVLAGGEAMRRRNKEWLDAVDAKLRKEHVERMKEHYPSATKLPGRS